MTRWLQRFMFWRKRPTITNAMIVNEALRQMERNLVENPNPPWAKRQTLDT